MAVRFHLRIPDASRIQPGPFATDARSPDGIAAALQDALRDDALFQRWRQAQPDPDDVDLSLAESDPAARVTGEQYDLAIDLLVTAAMHTSALRHRIDHLLGRGVWELRDVSAA